MVSGEYVERPAHFPYVYIVEANRYNRANYNTTSSVETAYEATFMVSVYSNLKDGAKEQCREILEVIHGAMSEMRFYLRSHVPVPNADSRVYRIVRRYAGVVRSSIDGNDSIYRIN